MHSSTMLNNKRLSCKLFGKLAKFIGGDSLDYCTSGMEGENDAGSDQVDATCGKKSRPQESIRSDNVIAA